MILNRKILVTVMENKFELGSYWNKLQQGAEVERQKRAEEDTKRWQEEHDRLMEHQAEMDAWSQRLDDAFREKREQAKGEEMKRLLEENRQELDSKLSKKHLLYSEKEQKKRDQQRAMLSELFK
jgi:hypothetical protein